jgi:hypothetical protein
MTTKETWTIADIRAANKAAGFYFFSPKTMKAFASKVDRTAYAGPGGVYFVTSEQFTPSTGRPDPRKYTVRRFNRESGDVTTVSGTHMKYYDVSFAREEAKRLAQGLKLMGEV